MMQDWMMPYGLTHRLMFVVVVGQIAIFESVISPRSPVKCLAIVLRSPPVRARCGGVFWLRRPDRTLNIPNEGARTLC